MPRRFLLDHCRRTPRAAGASVAPISLAAFLILLSLWAYASPASPAPGWSPDFAPPGPGGAVQTSISYQGDLIVGGNFASMGALPARNIARWDGSTWHAFGAGANNRVTASIIYNGDLIVAGNFTSIDGVAANRIARWDGSTWSPLAGGIEGGVTSLAVYEGELYAAGDFRHADGIQVESIARWNGTAWASTGFEHSPYYWHAAFSQLIVHAGALLGAWSIVPGVGEVIEWASYLASWDGQTWTNGWPGILPRPTSLMPTSLVVHGGDLYASGLWSDGLDEAFHVARLVNGEWERIGAEFPDQDMLLTSYQGRLLVAQGSSGGRGRSFVSEWTGSEWRRLATGPLGPVGTFGQHDGELIAGGTFGFADGPPVRGLAGWNAERWRSFGEFPGMGCDGNVQAIGAAPDPDHVVIAGAFQFAGHVPAEQGAILDDAGWQALPASQPYTGLSRSTTRIAFLGSDIFANGSTEWCGNHTCYDVDRFRDGDWEHLAQFNDVTFALHAAGGRLYVGGSYYRVGNMPASKIAAWDGHTWSSLATSLHGSVLDITSFNGQIVAGGAFDGTEDGSTAAPRVALWDGARWSGLGDGPGYVVNAVVEHAGGLVVAGSTSRVGEPTVYHVSRWDGHAWSPLGDAPDKSIDRLAVYRGRLIASGRFTHFGVAEASYLAEWNGLVWIPFGGGISGRVNGLAARGDDFYVVGQFDMAGQTPSWHIARWSETLAAPTEFVVAPAESTATLTWTLPEDPDVVGLVVRYAEGDYPTGITAGEALPGGSADGFFPGEPGSRFQIVHPQSADGGTTCYAAYAITADGYLSTPLYASFHRADLTPPRLDVMTTRAPSIGDSIEVALTSSERLDSSGTAIRMDGRSLPLRTDDASGMRWRVRMPVPESGASLQLDVCGTDPAGNATCRTIHLSGKRIFFLEGGSLVSPDGRLTLDVQPSGGGTDRVISIVWDPADPAGEHVYRIGPDGASVSRALLQYRYTDEELDGADPRQMVLRLFPPDATPSYVDPDQRVVRAWINRLGVCRAGLTAHQASQFLDPEFLRLEPPRPNPMLMVGQFAFELRDRVDAEVAIFDVTGRRVAQPFRGVAGPGRQVVTWNGRSDDGPDAPSGIFFVRVSTPGAQAVERIIRVR